MLLQDDLHFYPIIEYLTPPFKVNIVQKINPVFLFAITELLTKPMGIFFSIQRERWRYCITFCMPQDNCTYLSNYGVHSVLAAAIQNLWIQEDLFFALTVSLHYTVVVDF